MVTQITNYIDYLKRQHGLQITVHDRTGQLAPYMDALAGYNIHANAYCLYVKSQKNLWDKCRFKQNKVFTKCGEGAFFGMCFAGVEEFVLPFFYEGAVAGFVSVSGYRKNEQKAKERLYTLSNEYRLDREVLLSLYENHLCADIPDKTFVQTLIEPLCAMLTLLCAHTAQTYPENSYIGESNYIYGHILVYLRRNYAAKITLDDLAALCHCSKSYISHIFKKHSGLSVRAYINQIRLSEAKRLLADTALSIKEISDMVGFSDPNYFSNTFRAAFSASPKQYRAALHLDV
mgnify:FL=1